VNLTIVLDSGPLGLASNPKSSPESLACGTWLQSHLDLGNRVLVPEIAAYEIRRELIRAKKTRGIARLDAICQLADYLPITTTAMRLAADLWANARQYGSQTADDKSLDGDVILAAQAMTLGLEPGEMVIATDNVNHLSRFTTSARWQDI
jgi:predicted nucleic acid-binding protein